ncbi:hypothetical protein Aasi_0551 [Candidatus Amoebophilus asiaticus 5a2]|uniref:Uncharacterized protein n=1 Tax=Amoebophilus asiaticus (strain 5a2) TaxID=452471 RepID=B3ERV0_AMOA5|nr:hypothetical protein [Candidatus Amoebophilus asiaticus]ACE05952.1 hypothetical protein Aasi_0551 [Candidatus Amoebophilus asiaticus 5a2]
MLTNFQKHVFEEIEETGEYTFILLIPYFLEIEKGNKLLANGNGIGAYPQNYYINDSDFIILKNQVTKLFSNYNLGIYRYIGFEIAGRESSEWEDSHVLLSKDETNRILNNKEKWIYKQGAPSYLLAEKVE